MEKVKLAQTECSPKLHIPQYHTTGISLRDENVATKHNTNILIRSNISILQWVKLYMEGVGIRETAGIYKLTYKQENGTADSYKRMINRKIRMKGHKYICKMSYSSISKANRHQKLTQNIKIVYTHWRVCHMEHAIGKRCSQLLKEEVHQSHSNSEDRFLKKGIQLTVSWK